LTKPVVSYPDPMEELDEISPKPMVPVCAKSDPMRV